RLHRQADDVADTPLDNADVRVVAFLNGVGTRAALPRARGEIGVDLGTGHGLHGDAADFLPGELHVIGPAPEAYACPQFVLRSGQRANDAAGGCLIDRLGERVAVRLAQRGARRHDSFSDAA